MDILEEEKRSYKKYIYKYSNEKRKRQKEIQSTTDIQI